MFWIFREDDLLSHKILDECKLPLTGVACVDTIITEMGVINVDKDKGELVLVEIADGLTPEDVQARTGATLRISENLIKMRG